MKCSTTIWQMLASFSGSNSPNVKWNILFLFMFGFTNKNNYNLYFLFIFNYYFIFFGIFYFGFFCFVFTFFSFVFLHRICVWMAFQLSFIILLSLLLLLLFFFSSTPLFPRSVIEWKKWKKRGKERSERIEESKLWLCLLLSLFFSILCILFRTQAQERRLKRRIEEREGKESTQNREKRVPKWNLTRKKRGKSSKAISTLVWLKKKLFWFFSVLKNQLDSKVRAQTISIQWRNLWKKKFPYKPEKN